MNIRLHPATTHGDRLHRLDFGPSHPEKDVAVTVCGIRFVWGDWKGRTHDRLPRCAGCWP